ncbi:TPA: SAM-dependent DNA methyltransferase, partial [Clostridioides difficile]|nr:SAM-dependent DNA methyltransferase [Clostridioides difficile]
KRTEQSFFVDVEEIRENGYDLSINKYKEVVYEEVIYDAPNVILGRVKELEKEIAVGLEELERMLEV